MSKNLKAHLPTLIILTQREHQRLSNQAKRLQTYTLDLDTLNTYRAKWVDHLGYVDFLPMLLQAMESLIAQQAKGEATEAAYDEVVFQIGIYKKSCWSFIKMFYGSINPYVDRWLKVLPDYKFQFEQRYELGRKLTVAELMRALVDVVPNRDDPYNLRQTPEGSALWEAATRSEANASAIDEPPSSTSNVVELFSFKKKRR
ncbi:hypothetical protein [Halomonas llamarensis]|uniref:Uncharacterized protein n=1 Tax=Halomonas llamarensis TaxID=2945104 RepID=A0ABT0SUZ0_9GAMM|nr:hypothetical protein [Halomonas llamarensis]MCL7931576.1 hypothetical protein [Halomonas llamarensis]